MSPCEGIPPESSEGAATNRESMLTFDAMPIPSLTKSTLSHGIVDKDSSVNQPCGSVAPMMSPGRAPGDALARVTGATATGAARSLRRWIVRACEREHR